MQLTAIQSDSRKFLFYKEASILNNHSMNLY